MPHDALRQLPPVGDILQHAGVRGLVDEQGQGVVVTWARDVLDGLRKKLELGDVRADRQELLSLAVAGIQSCAQIDATEQFSRAINATGVVLHTSLGRAPLAKAAVARLAEVAGACNLEVQPVSGERLHRGYQLDATWRALTGCEDSLVVNNNAAATLLALRALCAGREVLISRGQLIEIGGSFRLPEVFAESGAILKEVGTTNRTRLEDYEQAIGPQTAAILRVHPSNYQIVGFAESPETPELARLAHSRGLLCLDDIGSGCLVDTTQFGLSKEPTFQESLKAGADLVLGSGDKLLGGPQCGVLLGKTSVIEQLRRHPLARAMRIDKLTLGALSATLELYRKGTALREVPALAMLGTRLPELRLRADRLVKLLGDVPKLQVRAAEDRATVGGGSLPGTDLPTMVVELRHDELSDTVLAERLRSGKPRVFSTIRHAAVCLDLRSVLPEDDAELSAAVRSSIETPKGSQRSSDNVVNALQGFDRVIPKDRLRRG